MKYFLTLCLSISKKLLFLAMIALITSFLWHHSARPHKNHPAKHVHVVVHRNAVSTKIQWKHTTVLVTEYLVRNNQDYPGRHCPVYSGRTASGVYVRVGMAAADWTVFPKGTTIIVQGYGKAVVTDTGGMIKGSHVDLASDSCYAALHWGRRNINIAYEEPTHG